MSRDAILASGQGQDRDDRRERHHAELQPRPLWADHRLEVPPGRVARLDGEPAIVPTLDFQHGPGHRRQHLTEIDRHRVEGPLGRALERERANEAPILDHRDRADRAGLAVSRELRMRAHDARGAAGERGVDDGAVLVDRLIHGRADRADEVGLLAEVRAVRDRAHAGATAFDEADADPLAGQPGRQRGDEGRRGAIEPLGAEGRS